MAILATFFNATGLQLLFLHKSNTMPLTKVLLILEGFVAGQIAIDCMETVPIVRMFFRAKFNDLVESKLPPKWCFKREMFHSRMVCIYTSNSTNYVHVQTTATTITTIGWASPALEHPKGRFLLDILVFRRKTTPSVHP